MPSKTVKLTNGSGLHARPAADFANAAGRFESDVVVSRGDKTANGKSVLSLLTLNCQQGDEITIRSDGPRAGEALEALVRLVEGGLGESQTPAAQHGAEQCHVRRST
jgi:phosphotransferase system HPr (HPr) family protein